MSSACCKEPGCRRSKPPLILQSSLSGRWLLLTDYEIAGIGYRARVRHDVSEQMQDAFSQVLSEAVNAGLDKATLDALAQRLGLQPHAMAAFQEVTDHA